MGITSVNNNVDSAVVETVRSKLDATIKSDSAISTVNNTDYKQNPVTTINQKQPSETEVQSITEELNNFMQSMNTDIKFQLHTKTNTLMIQVVEKENHKVLKEVPSHELLDMVARIRDCVGVFLDKKV